MQTHVHAGGVGAWTEEMEPWGRIADAGRIERDERQLLPGLRLAFLPGKSTAEGVRKLVKGQSQRLQCQRCIHVYLRMRAGQ
jgi:hypothetical protein